MKKYFGFIILLYILFVITTAFTHKKANRIIYYNWNRYNKKGDKYYSLSVEGGADANSDSMIMITNTIDTIYLKIETY